MVKTRRIIGITTLVLWAIAILPYFFFGFRWKLSWQLDVWAFLFALFLSSVYAIMLTVHITKGKHWALKTAEWLLCVTIVLLCVGKILLVTFGNTARYDNPIKHKVWSNKEYIVYSGYQTCFANPCKLYKKYVFIDKFVCKFGYYHSKRVNSNYTIYEPFDLIKEEFDISYTSPDSLHHETRFYRLSDGYPFKQIQNDSLLKVIKEHQ